MKSLTDDEAKNEIKHHRSTISTANISSSQLIKTSRLTKDSEGKSTVTRIDTCTYTSQTHKYKKNRYDLPTVDMKILTKYDIKRKLYSYKQ